MKFFCEYCGYHIDADNDAKCPNCGASYNRNKTYLRLEEEQKKNQEKIKSDNKKVIGIIKTIIIIIFIFALAFMFLVGLGIFKGIKHQTNYFNSSKNNESKTVSKTNEQIQNEIDDLNSEIDDLNELVNSLESEIDSINASLASLKAQQNKEFFDGGLSEKYYTLGNEIDKLQDSVREKESEIRKEKILIETKNEEIEKLTKELKNGK